MKLLVLTEDFYPAVSGGAHLKWRFCELAAERGHDIVVYTHRSEGMSKQETVHDVEIRRPFKVKPDSVPAHAALAFPLRLLFSAALFVYLLVSLRNSGVDGVYTGSNTLHWVGKVIARWKGVSGVSFVGYTPSLNADGGGIKRVLEWLTFRYALCSTVYCQNSAVKNRISDVAGRDARIIHGILHSEHVRNAHDRADDSLREQFATPEEVLLVFVGRLTEIKNVPAAIDAMALLPATYRLVIVGNGPERGDIEQAISRKGVEDRVQLVGEREHVEALSIVAIADGLLLPSRTESYPTVAFEGLALGCEVFTTPVGILREIDHPQLNVNEVGEFADALGATTFKRTRTIDEEAMELYSIERYAETILDVFDDG